jgi:hypothetical protein
MIHTYYRNGSASLELKVFMLESVRVITIWPYGTEAATRGVVKLMRLEAITRYASKRMIFLSSLTQRGPRL